MTTPAGGRPRGRRARGGIRAGAAALAALVVATALLPATASLAGPAVSAAGVQNPPAVLARGLNLVHWLRFPPRSDDASLGGYLDDASLRRLKRSGLTFVRLPVGLEVVMAGQHIAPDRLAVLLSIVRRIQAVGLGVMIEPHPQQVGNWDFGKNEAARQALVGFWTDLAPALRAFPAGLTFPETVNEPSDDAAGWNRLQARLFRIIRNALPHDMIVLTGANWGSVDGLVAVEPVADRNVIYEFHSYEPTILTLLGSWDATIDGSQLTGMPFPVGRQGCPEQVAAVRQPRARSVLQYWCSQPHDAGSEAATIDRAVAWGRDHHVMVALTEFGAVGTLNAPARNAYLAAIRQAAEQRHVPWGLWALDDQMGFDGQVTPSGRLSPLSPAVLDDLGLRR